MSNMNKPYAWILAALLTLTGNLDAQDASTTTPPPPAPVPAAVTEPTTVESVGPLSNLSTTLNIGYDSRYVLYGYSLSRHLYHADVSLYLPLNDRFAVWAGSWYGYLTDGTYNEVDVYAGIDMQLNAHLSTGIGYALFNYIEAPFDSDNAHEFAAHLTGTAGPLTLALRGQYDNEAEGTLARAILKFRRPLCQKLALLAEAEYGYAFEYYVPENAPNHALGKLSLPYQATATITLTPFVARSLALEAIEDFAPDRTYGGITMGMTF